MFKNIRGSWMTSLLGVAGGVWQMHQGGMTWGNAVTAAIIAGIGLTAKDTNVTGGTKVVVQ